MRAHSHPVETFIGYRQCIYEVDQVCSCRSRCTLGWVFQYVLRWHAKWLTRLRLGWLVKCSHGKHKLTLYYRFTFVTEPIPLRSSYKAPSNKFDFTLHFHHFSNSDVSSPKFGSANMVMCDEHSSIHVHGMDYWQRTIFLIYQDNIWQTTNCITSPVNRRPKGGNIPSMLLVNKWHFYFSSAAE